jgi:hypothetical protein
MLPIPKSCFLLISFLFSLSLSEILSARGMDASWELSSKNLAESKKKTQSDKNALPVPSLSISLGKSWHWQLQGELKNLPDVDIYDVDLFDTPIKTFQEIKKKSKDKKIICYFSAGTHEDWRKDLKDYPVKSLGKPLPDWKGERWFNPALKETRQVILNRLDLAKKKGCDAVEPDNIDAYANKTGLKISKSMQLEFNRFIASEAHKRGLSIGLKNVSDLAASLVNDFDWALVESCYLYQECDEFESFVRAGKAVFIAEYSELKSQFCDDARKKKFSLQFFKKDLGGTGTPCP